ncbi:hypothetical protein [Thalassovita sp.]|uniref:hypothetical protein n=1 Tax=Thalassovita sp. TaxID=1979401 RepID=UPI002881BE20|nr:hypothetical protein [Thalassovita sp.]MDF1802331.1 hypothetical protein [Thalassovita sp.]
MIRILSLFLALSASVARADSPFVENVEAKRVDMGWRISVTLLHPDAGWDHYANGWEILDTAGHRLGYRELMHPHDHEQPFTRSLSNVMLPDGTREVFIRARCSDDGWAHALTKLQLQP